MSCISKCQRCGSHEMFAPENFNQRKKRVGMQIRVKRHTATTTCEYALSVCEECAKAIQVTIDMLGDRALVRQDAFNAFKSTGGW